MEVKRQKYPFSTKMTKLALHYLSLPLSPTLPATISGHEELGVRLKTGSIELQRRSKQHIELSSSVTKWTYHHAENGISTLDLNDDNDIKEVVRSEVTFELAIWRAFTEDESRRNAPLTPENATRVMEAMRRISFGGITPEWANGVPVDRWINQLGRLRQSP